MPKGAVSNQNNFDLLLMWLDKDRESASKKYESIRLRLTKIFYAKGCHIADELADDTLERVLNKIPGITKSFDGDPAIYFYAVGRNVFREWTRKPKSEELPAVVKLTESTHKEDEKRDICLTKCLEKISSKQSEFIIEYYKFEKKQKIEFRKKLAEDLGVTTQALRVRAFRIRDTLQKCVLKCVEN